MLRQHHQLNRHMIFAEGSPNLMQRLPCLPPPPHVVPLLLSKLGSPLKCHKHHPIDRKTIYIGWCCIDRLNRQDFSGTGSERSMNAIMLLSRAERYWLQRFVWLDVKTAVLLDI